MELKMVYAVTLFLAQVYYTILIDPPNLNQNKYTWQTYSLNQTNTSVWWSNLFPFSKNTVELALTWTNKSYTSMEIKTVLIDEKILFGLLIIILEVQQICYWDIFNSKAECRI